MNLKQVLPVHALNLLKNMLGTTVEGNFPLFFLIIICFLLFCTSVHSTFGRAKCNNAQRGSQTYDQNRLDQRELLKQHLTECHWSVNPSWIRPSPIRKSENNKINSSNIWGWCKKFDNTGRLLQNWVEKRSGYPIQMRCRASVWSPGSSPWIDPRPLTALIRRVAVVKDFYTYF